MRYMVYICINICIYIYIHVNTNVKPTSSLTLIFVLQISATRALRRPKTCCLRVPGRSFKATRVVVVKKFHLGMSVDSTATREFFAEISRSVLYGSFREAQTPCHFGCILAVYNTLFCYCDSRWGIRSKRWGIEIKDATNKTIQPLKSWSFSLKPVWISIVPTFWDCQIPSFSAWTSTLSDFVFPVSKTARQTFHKV